MLMLILLILRLTALPLRTQELEVGEAELDMLYCNR
jgi:hypothetical protein